MWEISRLYLMVNCNVNQLIQVISTCWVQPIGSQNSEDSQADLMVYFVGSNTLIARSIITGIEAKIIALSELCENKTVQATQNLFDKYTTEELQLKVLLRGNRHGST